MDHERGADTTRTDPGELLIHNPGVPAVCRRAAELLGIAQPKKTDFSRFWPQLSGNRTRLVPVIRIGHDFGIDKPAQRLAPCVMFFGEMRVGQPSTVKIETHGQVLLLPCECAAIGSGEPSFYALIRDESIRV